MAKSKITSNDFDRFLEDSEESAAFSPQLSPQSPSSPPQKVETNASFSSLVGLQRKMIIFLYQSCKAARSSTTESLAIGHIASCCETSINSAKKTLQRLEQREFLSRFSFKDGRGGWTQYKISHDVFQDLLRAETEDKVGTQPETSPPSSSSRELFLNNSTTTQNVNNSESDARALKNLDFSTVAENFTHPSQTNNSQH